MDVNILNGIQQELVATLCLLEMYFVPSFFDIMVHLTVHLIEEVKLCGPVWYRWMYPFERYKKVLKSYVKKGYNVEGCIAECYIAAEALEYYAEYLKDVSAVRIPKSRINRSCADQGIGAANVIPVEIKLLNQAHQYILENTDEVEDYKEYDSFYFASLCLFHRLSQLHYPNNLVCLACREHIEILKAVNPTKAKQQVWLQDEHNRSFADWLRLRVRNIFNELLYFGYICV